MTPAYDHALPFRAGATGRAAKKGRRGTQERTLRPLRDPREYQKSDAPYRAEFLPSGEPAGQGPWLAVQAMWRLDLHREMRADSALHRAASCEPRRSTQ